MENQKHPFTTVGHMFSLTVVHAPEKYLMGVFVTHCPLKKRMSHFYMGPQKKKFTTGLKCQLVVESLNIALHTAHKYLHTP